MNWDGEAYREDGRRREIGSGFPCLTDELFTDGAKWQRDQLRTSEAHHRAARAIARMEPDEEWPDRTEHDAEYRHQCYDEAWDVITALLGEEPCPR